MIDGRVDFVFGELERMQVLNVVTSVP